MNTGFDLDILEEELFFIEDFDMSEFGFEVPEEVEEKNYSENEEVVEEILSNADNIKTEIKQGDIYQLGNHRLMCGDSSSESEIVDLLGGRTSTYF